MGQKATSFLDNHKNICVIQLFTDNAITVRTDLVRASSRFLLIRSFLYLFIPLFCNSGLFLLGWQ